MKQPITRIHARNFRSLGDVDLDFGPLTVLVGPNGSGKTNVLNVLRFLATTVRFDLTVALEQWRGFDHVQRQSEKPGPVLLEVEGQVTRHSSGNAPDAYQLKLSRAGRSVSRTEQFEFKRVGGRGRRYKVSGETFVIEDRSAEGADYEQSDSRRLASATTTGLATLPKQGSDEGGEGIRQFTEFLTSVQVLEPDVAAARGAARDLGAALAPDASNLADALLRLRDKDGDAFNLLTDDMRRCLPGLLEIRLSPTGGAFRGVAVELIESGLRRPTELIDASFGTVRLLALLAALHDPEPRPLLAIEEVDHGLHPYALDVVVDRMRAASDRTQVLATTHSPTLVNRLKPDELVPCDRDRESGESIIPSRSSTEIGVAMEQSGYGPGELWFAGALGGVPE